MLGELAVAAVVGWTLWCVISIFVLVAQLLRQPPEGEGSAPAPSFKRIGVGLMAGLAAAVAAMTLLIVGIVATRESRAIRGAVGRVEAGADRAYLAARADVAALLGGAGGTVSTSR